jgi:hypothetical protein
MNDRIDEWIEGPPRGAKSLQQFASGTGQAGGKWDAERDGEGTQLRFSRGTPNFRWTGYCVRERTRRGRNGGGSCASLDCRIDAGLPGLRASQSRRA